MDINNVIRGEAVYKYTGNHTGILTNCCRTDCGLCGVIFVYLALIMAFYGNPIASFSGRGSCHLSLCNRSHNVDMIRGTTEIVRTGNPIDSTDRSNDRSVVVIALDRFTIQRQ